jgi:hypothetical protein
MDMQFTVKRLSYYGAIAAIGTSLVVLVYFLIEKLVLKVLCSIVKNRLQKAGLSLNVISIKLRIVAGFCVQLDGVEIGISNLCHFHIQHVTFSFNPHFIEIPANKNTENEIPVATNKLYLIEFTRLSGAFFRIDDCLNSLKKLHDTMKNLSDLAGIFDMSIFSFKKTKIKFYPRSNDTIYVQLEADRFYLGHSTFEASVEKSSQLITLKPIENLIDRSKKKKIYRKDLGSLEAGDLLHRMYVHSVVSTARGIQASFNNHQSEEKDPVLRISGLKTQWTIDPLSLLAKQNEVTILAQLDITESIEFNVDLWTDLVLHLVQNFTQISFSKICTNFVASIDFPSNVGFKLKKQGENLFSAIASTFSFNDLNGVLFLTNPHETSIKLELNLDNLELHGPTSKLAELNSTRLELKLSQDYLNIELVSEEFEQNDEFSNRFYFNDIMLNMNVVKCALFRLDYLVKSSDIKFLNSSVVFSLGNCAFELPINSIYDEQQVKVNIRSENVAFKSTAVDKSTSISMLVLKKVSLFTDLNLFSIDTDSLDMFQLYCEKIVIESAVSDSDTKIQAFTSPIFAGSTIDSPLVFLNKTKSRSVEPGVGLRRSVSAISNTSCQSFVFAHIVHENSQLDPNDDDLNINPDCQPTEDEYFFGHNCFYLTVLQIRYQSFNSEETVYARNFELICGDLFGTMNLASLLNLTNLVYSFYAICWKEARISETLLNPYLSNSLGYDSIRILTSLVNFNVLDRREGSGKYWIND